MKKLQFLLVLAVMSAMSSCKTPSVLLNQNLVSNADIYNVDGRMGLQIKQKVNFGPYSTGVIKRGWISSYNIPFIIRFSGAKEKIFFSLSDSLLTSKIHCVGKIKQVEFNLVQSHFGILLEQEDAFAGNVEIMGGKTWDFIVHNASNSNITNPIYGFANCNDEKITIKAIRKFEGKNTILSELGVYGYEFILGDKVIGAVETLNKGRVIVSKELEPEYRLLVSSLSAALLLKTNLDDPANT